jgi:glycosyltransferase involved in cell wall biosynthesis
LIFNDGSTDRTGAVAESYAAKDPSHIQAFHHEKPISLGGIFQKGLKLSKYPFLIMIHGQNDIRPETLKALFSAPERGLVIPYQANTHERPWMRRHLSRLFVFLLNRSFGLNLHYYNHYVLHRKELLQGLRLRALGYAFQAEILLKLLLWKPCTYVEIPVFDDFSSKKATKAFRFKNIYFVFKFYLVMLRDIYGTQSDSKIPSAAPSADG